MQIIASDILADVSGLSLGLILTLIPVGLTLCLFGWWSQRFWIVLAATVTAGIIGLNEATQWRAQPIIAAVLLAIAAGVLALALVRVVGFFVGGVTGMALAQTLFPSLNQPLIVFLLCGLASLLMFRWCFMALTSFLGSVLLVYGVMALLHYYEKADAVRWSENNIVLLNGICWGVALAGFLFQLYFQRWRNRRRRHEDDEDEDHGSGGGAAILGMFAGRGRSNREAA